MFRQYSLGRDSLRRADFEHIATRSLLRNDDVDVLCLRSLKKKRVSKFRVVWSLFHGSEGRSSLKRRFIFSLIETSEPELARVMSKRRSKYHITACMIVTRKYVASGHERHIRYIPTCTSCWLYKWCRSIDNYVELHNFTFVRNANIVPFYLTCKEIFIGSIFFSTE